MGIAWAWPDVWFLSGFAERGAMADTEAGLLPGERLLWTGRPVRARVILDDLIFPGLLLAALLAALTLGVPMARMSLAVSPQWRGRLRWSA